MSRSTTSDRPAAWLVPLALTLILIGYLTVWLPLPPAGLRLVGFEMGEWVKFLPEVRAGLLPSRNFFYLPPITLGGLLILWTVDWPSGWQMWLTRGLAVGASLLAWPSLDIIRFEGAPEWRLRAAWVTLVLLLALVGGGLRRWPRVRAGAVVLLAASGMLLPGWAFLAHRPVIAAWAGQTVGIGLGVWLNSLGHLLLLIVGVRALAGKYETT